MTRPPSAGAAGHVATAYAVALASLWVPACDAAVDRCQEPLGFGEACDVAQPCCRSRVIAGVAAALNEAPLHDLPVDLISSQEHCDKQTQVGSWTHDELADGLQATARYRFGLHRELHVSREQVESDTLCSFFAGWYDSWSDRIELVLPDDPADRDLDKEVIVLSHELTHAYQDRRYDIRAWRSSRLGQGHENEALQAVLEGQAELVEHLVREALAGTHADDVDWAGWAVGRRTALLEEVDAAAEPWVSERYDFRYRYGTGLAVRHFLSGDLVANATWALFDETPWTTRQVIEAVEPGASLIFEPVDPHVGADVVEVAEAHGLWWFDTWSLDGWQTALWLAADVGAAAALAATEGWRGSETLVFLQEPALDPVFVMTSSWASEADADRFLGAVQAAITARALGIDAFDTHREGDRVVLVQGADAGLVSELAAAARTPW